MSDHAFAKEASLAFSGEIKQLIRDDDVSRSEIFAQRAAGAHADDPLYTEGFKRVDIGAVIDLAGGDVVADAVAGEKCHRQALQFADDHRRAGFAKWGIQVVLFGVSQAGHAVKPGAAEDSQGGAKCHNCSSA